MTDAPPTRETPWSVALFASKVKGYIDRLGTAWVEGEITQWGDRGNAVYGKLKDLEADATVSFNVWGSVRAKFTEEFAQGDRVIALLKPDYWVKGGSLSMNVLDLRHVGLGDLLAQLQRLKAALQKEGLFDASRKKPLPFLPQCIGLITGRDSDAEKDVLRNAQLRWPSVRFRRIHTPVQGDTAAREVTAAIQTLDADPEVDVIIIARGGGDFQNLLPFSDETLVRTAAAASTPIVSAIGHEADRPLLDEVADLRASTPTDAAKRVVPDVAEEITRVQQARTRMSLRVTSLITAEIDRVGALRTRPVMASGDWIID
ncbi:MAG TPA: exodeoxyribonuclease VII large subunit, partial [Terrimesophilobacter sp.]|nr:exodeoxyribonuclease VII large subunit [Terrimesophilobacter sp.]